jgi:membrane fusion protein, multidrug efflux system
MDGTQSHRVFVSRTRCRLPFLAAPLEMSDAHMAQPGKLTSRNPPWVRVLGRTLSGILALAALVLAWFVYRMYYANPRTDDAYVHANTASLAAHVSGQIVQVPIKDNQHVKKGDLLFLVDSRPYKLALDAAQTKLNLTEIGIKNAA